MWVSRPSYMVENTLYLEVCFLTLGTLIK
jgi:hypothetical protein